MADNFAFTPGVGSTGAADDIDGVLYPRVKITLGANNSSDGDVNTANPMPVTGTVTANLSATDNAVLDSIDGKITAVNTGAVTVAASALPTGASTAANQTTIIGHVDGIETLLGTIDADTSKIPALGQALEAASVPVVLPAGQLTTLTPPAAITGFATSAKQDTLIGHVDGVETLLGTIDADTSALAGAVAGTEVQVDVVSSALPTGASTAAKQPALGTAGTASTDVISVQGIASMTPLVVDLGANNDVTVTGSVTADLGANNDVTVTGTVDLGATDNAVLDAIAADGDAIQTVLGTIDGDTSTLAGAVSGTEMQVDVVGALPAGTNAIGKLAANSGVDIGDVDVLSLPALPAGTNTIGKVAPNEYELAGNTTHVKKYYTNTGAATDGIIWSPAAGKRWYVTDIFIQVSAAATVTLEDDLTAGDSAIWKAELAANSGWSHSFITPLFSGEDAADLLITTTAGNVYVTCTGYEI
jgi:hypothetical protein